jgi:hypothetical protein
LYCGTPDHSLHLLKPHHRLKLTDLKLTQDDEPDFAGMQSCRLRIGHGSAFSQHVKASAGIEPDDAGRALVYHQLVPRERVPPVPSLSGGAIIPNKLFVPVEVCQSSNMYLLPPKVVTSVNCPLGRFIHHGVPVVLGTDNFGVMRMLCGLPEEKLGGLTSEFSRAAVHGHFAPHAAPHECFHFLKCAAAPRAGEWGTICGRASPAPTHPPVLVGGSSGSSAGSGGGSSDDISGDSGGGGAVLHEPCEGIGLPDDFLQASKMSVQNVLYWMEHARFGRVLPDQDHEGAEEEEHVEGGEES